MGIERIRIQFTVEGDNHVFHTLEVVTPKDFEGFKVGALNAYFLAAMVKAVAGWERDKFLAGK